MQQFIRSKQINNQNKQTQNIKKVKHANHHKIPKVGHRQIPTHTFYKTFYHHKNHETRQIQPMKIYFSQTKQYNESPHKGNYDRPIHLLKKYLERKQRLHYETPINNKSEPAPDKNIEYKTMNEFRIKKSKRIFDLTANQQEIKPFSKNQTKLQSLDEDFANFNTSKNIYSMTFQELQESIRWKKQFLQILNRKMTDSKKVSYRIKNFS